jgi:hypothetical protein
MDVLPRPEVILTHESDLDGFVSGHLLQRLARHLYQTEVRLEAWNTQAWRQRPMKERAAWICDLAFDSRTDRPDWVIIDHHPTDLKPAHARLIHDLGKSASVLCYELCRSAGLGSRPLDRLVDLTDIGDRFLEDHPEFSLSQDYAALVTTYHFWNLSRLLDGEIERVLDHPLLEVIQTRRRVEDPIGFAWSRSRVVEINPEVGYVEVVIGNTNLIVHHILRSTDCPFPVLATLVRKGGSGIGVGLRSRDGKALAIARKLQGGGHPNAAGAALPRSIQGVPEALDYLRKVLNPQPLNPAALGNASSELSLS